MAIIDDMVIRRIRKEAINLIALTDKLEDSSYHYYFESFQKSTEESLRRSSSVYMMIRELLRWFYSLLPNDSPSLPQMEAECFNVSFEKLKDFSYPVFKISMPFLLPNKRKRNLERNNAITSAVISAVSEYRDNNRIDLIRHATVFFVSSNMSSSSMIDNDNKEAKIILDGCIGKVLCDDRAILCNTVFYTFLVDDPEEVKTEVYIVDSEHDVEVFSMIKKI